MRFEWDEEKNRNNRKKHGVSFETATLVFDDPYALTKRDPTYEEEERFLTVGAIGPGAILFVVHTSFENIGRRKLSGSFPLVPQALARARSMKKLTKQQKREIAAIAAKKDSDIDFSDIPEVLNWSDAEVGKFYRPAKKPVTMRLDADVIEWLKGYGPGYQTKANMLLRHAMVSTKAPKSGKKKRTA